MATYAQRSASAALAARGAGVASSESIAQRSLFVRVRPTPVSLSERRSVLRLLERYGQTDLFKKMADNASFIVIASSAAMANALIQRSPLQYDFLGDTLRAAQPWGDTGAGEGLPVAAHVQPVERRDKVEREAPTGSPSPAGSASVAHTSFVLSVFPSQDYHHRTELRRNPLHGCWPADATVATPARSGATYKDSFVYKALRAVVPESAASEALCDWRPRTEDDGDVPADVPASRTRPALKLQHIRERQARRDRAKRSVLASLLRAQRRASRGEQDAAAPGATESRPEQPATKW